jgi:catechol 2,3-dioxygenase-like lactoylglutathione lyase family enzyme
LFSHVTVGTSNLGRAGLFYDALLIPIGLKRRVVTPDGGPLAFCWVNAVQPLPRFYVYEPFDGNPASVGNGGMIAFLAPTIESVNLAYLRDPDGNKVHIAFRGDL